MRYQISLNEVLPGFPGFTISYSCAYIYVYIGLGQKFELEVDMSNYCLHDKLRLLSQMKMKKIVLYLCLKSEKDF